MNEVYFNEEYLNNPCLSCHSASMIELKNGDLLCSFSAGTREGNADSSIYICRKNKGESIWSAPVCVSDDSGHAEGNASFFETDDGELWLVFASVEPITESTVLRAHQNLQYTSVIRRKRSMDNGNTWSASEDMITDGGSFCRQPIQRLDNGKLLFATWRCYDDDTLNASDETFIYRSNDEGATWDPVLVPRSKGLVHCNLIDRKNGRITAFFRSRHADYIYRAESLDQGETWSVPKVTELPNNNASISAIELQDGNLAIAYNACGFSWEEGPAKWPSLRAPITIAISDNDGESFDFRRIIEQSDGFCGKKNYANNRKHSYPFLLQTKDGMLHVGYTYANRSCIKVCTFTRKWVTGEETVDDGLEYRY